MQNETKTLRLSVRGRPGHDVIERALHAAGRRIPEQGLGGSLQLEGGRRRPWQELEGGRPEGVGADEVHRLK